MMELWKSGPRFEQSEHFRLGTDSVLLADFVNTSGRTRGIDLGCGSGILPLLLCARAPKLNMTGLEINPDAVLIARKNMTENSLDGRTEIVQGDIRSCRELFRTGEFDLIVSNPPYFAAGSGRLSPDAARAAARGEVLCTLEDICRAASYLCRTGGAFCLVHRAERLADAVCLLRETGFELKRIRTVAHSVKKAPSLVLLEARRGAAPGLKFMPPLFMTAPDGRESDEIKRIYHREDET